MGYWDNTCQGFGLGQNFSDFANRIMFFSTSSLIKVFHDVFGNTPFWFFYFAMILPILNWNSNITMIQWYIWIKYRNVQIWSNFTIKHFWTKFILNFMFASSGLGKLCYQKLVLKSLDSSLLWLITIKHWFESLRSTFYDILSEILFCPRSSMSSNTA